MPPSESSNYILFSDVHLGADLVQHVQPWTLSRLKQVARIDRDLAAMLDHYRERSDPERPWRLVIAGDLVDFIGMSIAPAEGSELYARLTAEERTLGLGSTSEHAGEKMRAVASRHGLVFERLAAFLADGHSLVLVRGNHDVDFHWETARRAFVDAIVERLPAGQAERSAFVSGIEERVEFCPWFYYEEGLLYVEHGHQFDAMCSYHHLLAPVSPRDPRRISWSFSDILLRTVVRPTLGLGSQGHDRMGPVDYLRLGLSLGVRGGARLAVRFLTAIARALRRWRAHVSQQAQALREEHDRHMTELAGRMRVGLDQLRAVAGLWPTPVTRNAVAVLRSMFMDRILVLAATLLLAGGLGLLLPMESWIPAYVGLAATVTAIMLWSRRTRRLDIEPARAMFEGARRIAELMHTRFVVMGHTHEPALVPVGELSTYVNLGNWGSDDADVADTAPRTHLVIRFVNGEHRAELLRWVPGLGPAPLARNGGGEGP